MRSPVEALPWLKLPSVGSTQDVAAQILRDGEQYGAVWANDQVAGRGRFSREWLSQPGDSLTMSLIFRGYADHAQPHLIGMAVAVAAARFLGVNVQWPNDLVFQGRKVGGLLTELLLDDKGGKVPVVGVGVNLNQQAFPPEIANRAVSMWLINGQIRDSFTVASGIVSELTNLPEPASWSTLVPDWMELDQTPGKIYRAPDGREIAANGIGKEGELIGTHRGETVTAYAADALFGVKV